MHLSKSSRLELVDRRTLVLGLPLMLALRAPGTPPLLARAIARAGGRAALKQARTLHWTGTAAIYDGDRTIRIGVDTRVEPFVRVRSNSWLLEQGPSATRSIVFESGDAWLERKGARLPMPDGMREHERQQYAIYGLMRLVDLDRPGVIVTQDGDMLRVRHPAAPTTLLRFDRRATLIGAENEVPGAENGKPIRQVFRFSGHRMANGILWPRTIFIEQNGKPYFELRMEAFSAG
ncbi:hypothetical protein HJG53_12035 [Sphingomonas sp. ID1715]|uniref:hypothetical protein n=1 Tax=Sphingomonas sp. ID1715 TaxID=1656898 RepID=UPI0014892B3B|nr:hypothetical protein [Sphingomonas sp. ID1715]NNM77639.1 hypothetical protein [Sphingomonas sp. ID1715]